MPITTGGFDDLVQLSQDTLYYVGPDLEIGNTSVGSSASIGFNNTAGVIQVVGVATGNETLWLPTNNGTLATVVTFSNSNNVSFGLNGSTMTATASVASSLTAINVSAGTTSNNLSAMTFSNGSNVSFGLNASILTASVATSLTAVNVSAGTTSNNLSAVTFSNSNGVSFGLNGSVITASAGQTTISVVNFSAGTTSSNLQSVVFSNSGNISFGLNGATITASANVTGDWYDNVVVAQPNGVASGAMGAVSNFTGSASSLFVAPMQGYGDMFPFDITANTCFFPDVSISGATSAMSVAFTSKWVFGIYTLNASSLSLLNSGSVSFGFAGAATNNSTGYAGGFRYGSFSSAAWSSSPVFRYGSRYWLGWFWSSSGTVAATGSMAGAFLFSTGQRSGLLGASNLTATSNGAAPFFGIFSAQTAAMPASIGSNQLQKTGSMAGFVPHFVMANNASLTVF